MTGRILLLCSLAGWIAWGGVGCSRKPEPEPKSLTDLRARFKPTGVKVCLIGVDGATFKVMDPLLVQGKLPAFKRLIDGGARGNLASIKPMYSPALWTSIVTGRSRVDHGIDYFTTAEPLGDVVWEGVKPKDRLVSSLDRRCLALWNVASAFDLSSGIIGWWASWPAEKVKGYVISDRAVQSRFTAWMSGDFGEHRTYPDSLGKEIAPLLIDPAKPPMHEIEQLVELTPEEKTEFLEIDRPIFGHGLSVFKYAHCNQRSFEEIALKLLETQGQKDLMALFLVANDPISHTFWHYYDPDAFKNIDPKKAQRLGRLIPNYYEHNDHYLQRFLPRLDEDTVVIVASDHGFQPTGVVPKMTARTNLQELRKSASNRDQVAVGQSGGHHVEGVLIACGGPIKKGVQVEAHNYDVTPTILALLGLPVARDMEGRVLTEIIDDEFLNRHPVRYVKSYESLIQRQRPTDVADLADPETMQRLKALGYVGSDEKDDEAK